MAEVTAVSKRIIGNIEKVIIGKRQEIILALVAYLSEGHILLEDVPGVAKTMLARALASSVGASFKRVQCTPDLLPTDITGASIFNPKTTEFAFRRGPIFSQIFLADEINRATPRTQSALLEAMAEQQVTVSGVTYPLAPPYFVMATLNPIEMEGTYPLPEAQLDRFLFKVRLGYPGEEEMVRIIGATTGSLESPVEPVFAPTEAADAIERLKRLVREVMVAPMMEHYAARMARATQPPNSRVLGDLHSSIQVDAVSRYVSFGSSPRGAQALILGAKVRALLDGRANIAFEDIDRVAPAALEHRLMLNYAAHTDDIDAAMIVGEVVKAVQTARR
jgi:MoxR-like ATPase